MSPKWLPLLIAPALLALNACGGDGSSAPSPTPTPTEPAPTLTAVPTPAVEKPDPQTLVPAGYVFDQSLEMSVDGSQPSHIVVISHTVANDKTGQPVAATVPDQCPDNDVLLGSPSPCAFRVEIFAYDPASMWTSVFLEEDDNAAGLQQGVQAHAFNADVSERQALILTSVICAADSCPFESHSVLTMKDGAVTKIYNAFKATLALGTATAMFDEPEYADDDPLCCPSARRITTVGFNQETGEVGVIDVQIESN
jgi:hypothetical protein